MEGRGNLDCDIMVWKSVTGKGGMQGTTYEATSVGEGEFKFADAVAEAVLPDPLKNETVSPPDQLKKLIAGDIAITNKTEQKQISNGVDDTDDTSEVIDAEVVEVSDDTDPLDVVCNFGVKHKGKSLREILIDPDTGEPSKKGKEYMAFLVKNVKDDDVLKNAAQAVIDSNYATNGAADSDESSSDSPDAWLKKCRELIEKDDAFDDEQLLTFVKAATEIFPKSVRDELSSGEENHLYDIPKWVSVEKGGEALQKLYGLLSRG